MGWAWELLAKGVGIIEGPASGVDCNSWDKQCQSVLMWFWDANSEPGGMSVSDHELDKLDRPTVFVLGWTAVALLLPLCFA